MTIHSASGLRRHNGSAVSSVYVRVRVGDHESKTKTSIGEVLRWDQQFELSVSDSRSQSLVLEICDKSTLHSFAGVVGMGKDHVVGYVGVERQVDGSAFAEFDCFGVATAAQPVEAE